MHLYGNIYLESSFLLDWTPSPFKNVWKPQCILSGLCCTGPTDERKDGLHYHYKPSLYKVVYNWVWKRQIYIQNKVKELWSIIGYSTASNVCKFMHFCITIKSVCLYNFKYNREHLWNFYKQKILNLLLISATFKHPYT